MASVDILCPTYNCALHIRALVDSIRAQSHQDWRLILRDDGSTDGTVDLLKKIKAENGPNVQVVQDELGNLGPVGSFERLLSLSNAPYAMFCDHDDVWLQDKIAVTLERMRVLEIKQGEGVPCLVHTDLKVTDDALNVQAQSLWDYQHLDAGAGCVFTRLLLTNVITGCTVMINEALRERALPFPDGVIMHDWWAGLVASQFGEIASLPQPTILYRQHGQNDTGAKSWGYLHVLKKVPKFFDTSTLDKDLARASSQAAGFLSRFGNDLPPERRRTLQDFAGLPAQNWLRRRLTMIEHGILRHGLVRNLSLLLRM